MYKFGFIVLNYNTYDDTMNFVKSVEKNVKKTEYEIIIVDNHSSDNSGNLLKKEFENNKNITVILNNDNYGFSKGNNIGIEYGVKELKCDFIVMTNSDTCIIQNDFCENIVSEYEKSFAAIIGPEVNNPDGNFQFPVYPESHINIKKLKKLVFALRVHLFLNKIGLDNVCSNLLKLVKKEKKTVFENRRKEDVILHGSCIIFTPKYFTADLIGIPEKTKFYCEEQFIYLYAKKNNFKIVYNPQIKILHKINGATANTYKNNKSKMEFKYQNKIESNKALIKYLEDNK